MRWLYLLLPALILTGCANTPQQPRQKAQARLADIFRGIDVEGLGKRIWANECAGSVQGLVSWNAGENFPSLGIGHFIWYPAGVQGPFDESLPRFVAYARSRGVQVPAYFNGAAPWPTKAAFEADRSGLANRMRQWLAAHVELQTQFIILRSRVALPKMMKQSSNPAAVREHYQALARTTQGMYCLVDYVNFKGEGTKSTERYNGYGWGLLQVLEEMRGTPQGHAATAEFSRAACAVMRRRVANAPAARGEQRWLPGWLNRCKTYQ
ncbi:MAG: hypothetical protein IKV82_07315 [Akkermansia sp.]|nr:hypothetical protein [Akkermansia sp.]